MEDLYEFMVPRIRFDQEQMLGELIVAAFSAWSEADKLENELGERADRAIRQFIRVG